MLESAAERPATRSRASSRASAARSRLVVRLRVQGPQGRGRRSRQQENVERLTSFTIPMRHVQPAESRSSSATPPPPNLATRVGGKLRLNVGDAAEGGSATRGTSTRAPSASSYEIAHVGGIARPETIRVTAFGRPETFRTASRASRPTSAAATTRLLVLDGRARAVERPRRQRQRHADLQRLRHRRSSTATRATTSLYVRQRPSPATDDDRARRRHRQRHCCVNDSAARARSSGGTGTTRSSAAPATTCSTAAPATTRPPGRGGTDTVDGGADNDLIRRRSARPRHRRDVRRRRQRHRRRSTINVRPVDAIEIFGAPAGTSIRVLGGRRPADHQRAARHHGRRLVHGVGVERLGSRASGGNDTFLLDGALEPAA